MNAKTADIIAWEIVRAMISKELANPSGLTGEYVKTSDDQEKIGKALRRCESIAWDKLRRAGHNLEAAEKRKADAKNCPCFRCGALTGKPKPKYKPIYCARCRAEMISRYKEDDCSDEYIARLLGD